MQHSVESYDKDMKSALVDLYFDLGGAEGKGLKRPLKHHARAGGMSLNLSKSSFPCGSDPFVPALNQFSTILMNSCIFIKVSRSQHLDKKS